MGATPHEAWQEFLDRLKSTIACLGRAKIIRGGGDNDAVWFLNQPGGSLLVPRRDEPAPVALRAEHRFRISHRPDAESRQERYRVTSTAYRYHIVQGGRDAISFHWHPVGNSHVTAPHLHLGVATLHPDGVLTPRMHHPSPRIAVEDVAAYLIQEFGCLPTHDDWRRVLRDGRTWFEDNASWGVAESAFLRPE